MKKISLTLVFLERGEIVKKDLCCISINVSPLGNTEVKEKGSRWNWIPWFIHCTRQAKFLLVWPSQSRIYFWFFYELSSGSFVDLSKENSFVCKKHPLQLPYQKGIAYFKKKKKDNFWVKLFEKLFSIHLENFWFCCCFLTLQFCNIF